MFTMDYHTTCIYYCIKLSKHIVSEVKKSTGKKIEIGKIFISLGNYMLTMTIFQKGIINDKDNEETYRDPRF